MKGNKHGFRRVLAVLLSAMLMASNLGLTAFAEELTSEPVDAYVDEEVFSSYAEAPSQDVDILLDDGTCEETQIIDEGSLDLFTDGTDDGYQQDVILTEDPMVDDGSQDDSLGIFIEEMPDEGDAQFLEPVPTLQEYTVHDRVITVTADAGVFPGDAALYVDCVEDAAITQAAENALGISAGDNVLVRHVLYSFSGTELYGSANVKIAPVGYAALCEEYPDAGIAFYMMRWNGDYQEAWMLPADFDAEKDQVEFELSDLTVYDLLAVVQLPEEDQPQDVAEGTPGEQTEDVIVQPDEIPMEEPASQPADDSMGDSIAEAQPVSVVFDAVPETALVTVYPAATEEAPEPEAIPAQEDGSFLLLPGEYAYSAQAEGYVPVEAVSFTVTDDEQPMLIFFEMEAVAEEIPEPAAFDQSRTVNGVVVTVKADPGVFPADAVLSVETVPVYQQQQADTAVDEVRGENQNVAVSYTFDIKVIHPETGEEYQPAEGQTVSVSFALAEVVDENLETQVYHVTEDEATGELTAESLDVNTEITPETGEATTAVVETDGFSIYTVEFTYNNLEYVLPGSTSVPMSEILTAVGLTGEVTAAEVSDASLFSVSNETGEWIVTAHQAFDTTEWMKVTINGVVYEITVIDDGEITTWADLQAALSAGGSVTLTQNITASSSDSALTVPSGKTVTLDLNGYTLDRGLYNQTTNTPTANGYVIKNSGTLTIKDTSAAQTGKITGGNNSNEYSPYGGGIYNGGTLTLESGAISGNHAHDCSGVYNDFSNGVSFTMNGGAISGNVSDKGGAGVGNYGTFTMNGGTISGNSAVTRGGGVWSMGTFTMNGGAIENNTAGDNGGGVCVRWGYATISGGVITGNRATGTSEPEESSDDDTRVGGCGGGLYIDQNCEVTISGGTITGNTAANKGGDVYLHLNGSSEPVLKMQGSPVANVYLAEGKVITVSGAFTEGADIGVSTAAGAGVFTSGYLYIRKNRTVDLIVLDGVTLTCKKGIGCGYDDDEQYATLNIFGAGTIVTTGQKLAAGIGGKDNEASGNITIHGCTITATGGEGGAGIGGGDGGQDPDGTTSIKIYAGTITATGGKYGAGIGGGDEQPGAHTYIYGGTITATSTEKGAGIGGGDEEGILGVFIYGGTVTAIGGEHGAGIGAGEGGGNLRKYENGGGVNIMGGTVSATGGKYGAGIGAGFYENMSGTVRITGTPKQVTIKGGSGAAGIGGGDGENNSKINYNGDMKGTVTIDCANDAGLIKISGGLLAAGIGGGFTGNMDGKVYIKGGNVEVHAGGGGAGIGGGMEVDNGAGGEGGDVYIGGGTLKIYCTTDYSDAQAIGYGTQVAPVGSDPSGSVYIASGNNKTGKYMRVCYSTDKGKTWSTAKAGDRSSKCHQDGIILLVTECNHCDYNGGSGLSYTANNDAHTAKCKYCSISFTEEHTPDASGKCTVCAYETGNGYVSFDSNGGSDVPGQSIPAGGTAARPEDPIYEGEGFSFDGWYLVTDEATGAVASEPFDFNTVITGSVILIAVWNHEHDGITFQSWNSDSSLPSSAGSYFLTKDVTLTGVWSWNGGTLNLCLAGHTVTGNIDNSSDALITVNGGTLNLFDEEDGTVTLVNARAATVAVETGGTFNLHGGTVTSETNDSSLQGVDVAGTFHMSGGRITGNPTGVRVKRGGAFTVSGSARVTGNTVNVDLTLGNGKIQIGGALSDDARIGVTAQAGVFTNGLNGGGDTPNGTAANFFSDSDDYLVALNAAGEAMLETAHTVTFEPGDENASGYMPEMRVGSAMTLPACDYSVEGKVFKEWSVKIGSAEPVSKQPEETIEITADTTVTAVWEDATPAQYTVTIESDAGCVVTVYIEDSVGEGGSISSGDTVPAGTVLKTNVRPKAGYHLTTTPDESYPVTGDLTIRAASALNTYTVTATAADGGEAPTVSAENPIPYGTKVTFTAGAANEGYEFAGWYQTNGVRLSTESEFSRVIYGDYTIEARYRATTNIVTFMANGQEQGKFTGSTITAADFPPAPSAINGTQFDHWDMTVDEINAQLQQGRDVTVTAVFTKIQNTFTVTVYNGEAEEPETIACTQTTTITRKASAVDGKEFAWWTMDGERFSYNSTVSFYATKNCELRAVYASESVEAEGTATIRSIAYNPDTRKLSFNAYLTVPDGAIITAAGLVAASGAGTYNPDEPLTTANADYTKALAKAAGKSTPVDYTWNKTNVNPGDVWYVRARIVYTDAAGETHEIYGERLKVTAGTDYDASEKGTAAIRSVSYNESTKKLSFNAYLTVPDDATINKAGLVAIGSGFDPHTQVLTASNAAYVKSLKAAEGKCTPVDYTWNKTKVETGDTWYARAYLVYTDAAGVQHTVYGELITAVAN